MYDTVLIPTDGSDQATRAARHGLALARAFDATVHVLSVVDLQRAAGPFDAGGVDKSFRERLEAEATEAVAAVEALDGAAMRTATVEGRPAPAILEYADEHGVDLVNMGTHGRRGLRRFVAGSVTETVLRQSPVPVVTVRTPGDDTGSGANDGERAPEYDSVLVPTDGSDCADIAVEHAVAVAEAFDATVHALGVADIGVVAAQSDVTPATSVLDALEKQAEAAVATVEGHAADAGVEAVTAVQEGYPARTTLEYVEDERIDLVAMGTHGRGGVERFLLGSTTERLVRNADVPVLTVRLADEE